MTVLLKKPPIAVFCYNRPHHLKACLEAIDNSLKHLKEKLPIYIFCDYADSDAVKLTRKIAHSYGSATVIERERNFGFHNIIEGISWLCNTYGRAIIIEDDILIAPDFLPFMVQGLDRYENNPRVFSISGFMYADAQPQNPQLFFQPFGFIWGWATWKRAWDQYDYNANGWREYLSNRRNKHRYNCFNSIKFSKHLEKTMTGKWNTWDCQWSYCIFRNNGLVLSPHLSLIWNCGCGGGVHGDAIKNASIDMGNKEVYIHGNMKREDFHKPRLQQPLTFPKEVSCSERSMRYLAVNFLKEYLRHYRKKRWRAHFKIWINKVAAKWSSL